MDIQKKLQDSVDKGAVQGVVAAAATDKGVIFEGAAGGLKTDSVVWIASMTKAITGAAAMQLVEKGKLSLDTPAAEIVPAIAEKQVLLSVEPDGAMRTRPPARPITLRHLLTHTSGMGYDTWDGMIYKYVQAKGTLKPASMEVLSTPLTFDPGDRWCYSISIDWAGLMVEAVSGMKLDRYMKENIFDPLGMADTGFRITPQMRPRKAAVHVRKEGGGFTATDHELNQNPEVFQGGGALYSTMPDYLKFTRALLAGGAPILKPATVKEMFRNSMNEGVVCRSLKSYLPARSTDMNFVDGMKWGLTFMINPEPFPGRRAANSLTWGGLANSYFWIDPERKVTGVWATQLLPFYDPRAVEAFEDFERGVYASL